VGRGVGHLVHLGHHALRVDQEGDALGEVGVRLVGPFFGPVEAADGAIDVAQQGVGEAVFGAERPVLRGRVEARAEDLGAERIELWASITEALAFTRSAARRGLGIPPEHDPRAPQISERDGVALVVGKRELRSGRSGGDHPLSIRSESMGGAA
jgi:hypothetical protein